MGGKHWARVHAPKERSPSMRQLARLGTHILPF